MLAFFTPQWGSRVDQDVGPRAGSTTSPLPGKLSGVAENAISVPSFGTQLPLQGRPYLLPFDQCARRPRPCIIA